VILLMMMQCRPASVAEARTIVGSWPDTAAGVDRIVTTFDRTITGCK